MRGQCQATGVEVFDECSADESLLGVKIASVEEVVRCAEVVDNVGGVEGGAGGVVGDVFELGLRSLARYRVGVDGVGGWLVEVV